MKDYKLETFSNQVGKNQSKTTGLKTKGFGYQILGFGSGGGAPTYDIEFLVVAGGGCGGNSNFGFISGGGGGAGGYRTSTQTVVLGQTVTVTVGDGGPNQTTDGDDSSIS